MGHFIAKEKTANHEWVMEVPDLIKEVDLVFARKKRCTNAVNRRVAPTLLKELSARLPLKSSPPLPHLVVKSTLLVQKLDKLRVRLTPPKVQVTDLKVAPD